MGVNLHKTQTSKNIKCEKTQIGEHKILPRIWAAGGNIQNVKKRG